MSETREISWPQLVVLMTVGDPAYSRVRGRMRVLAGSDLDGDLVEYAADLDGLRQRVTGADGRLVRLCDREHTWLFAEGDRVPTRAGRLVAFGRDFDQLTGRRPLEEWQPSSDGDFTDPLGPPRAVTFLGADAWEFDLAAPARKREDGESAQVVVDARTGLILSWTTGRGLLLAEWTEFATGPEVKPFPTDHFTWTGPSRELDEVRAADLEVQRARNEEARAAAVDAGLADLTITLRPIVDPERWHTSRGRLIGHFQLGEIYVERRPIGSARTARDSPSRAAEVVTWSDGGHEWSLSCDTRFEPVERAVLEQIRDALQS